MDDQDMVTVEVEPEFYSLLLQLAQRAETTVEDLIETFAEYSARPENRANVEVFLTLEVEPEKKAEKARIDQKVVDEVVALAVQRTWRREG